MSKQPVELSDDGELSQPVEYDEKPKRKRGESRSITVPIVTVLAIVIIFGIALFAMSLVFTNPLDVSPEDVLQIATQMGFSAQDAPPSCNLNPPQGERIAYVSSDDSSIHIRSLSTGDDCTLVSFLQDNLTELALSADGERVAYTRLEGTSNDLWVMNVNGTGGVNLTSTLGSYVRNPAWSPDGQQIVFTTVENNIAYITLINADGRNLRLLAQGGQPTWSPDGTRIAFGTSSGESSYITVMNADGTNVRRVTNSTEREAFFAWSPDSTRILFARADESAVYVYNEIYTVDPNDPLLEHQFVDRIEYGVVDLAWLSADRFAYASVNALHTRLFPPNEGSNGDTVIIEDVSTFDWWTP